MDNSNHSNTRHQKKDKLVTDFQTQIVLRSLEPFFSTKNLFNPFSDDPKPVRKSNGILKTEHLLSELFQTIQILGSGFQMVIIFLFCFNYHPRVRLTTKPVDP
jgi:hypothetical protein